MRPKPTPTIEGWRESRRRLTDYTRIIREIDYALDGYAIGEVAAVLEYAGGSWIIERTDGTFEVCTEYGSFRNADLAKVEAPLFALWLDHVAPHTKP